MVQNMGGVCSYFFFNLVEFTITSLDGWMVDVNETDAEDGARLKKLSEIFMLGSSILLLACFFFL